MKQKKLAASVLSVFFGLLLVAAVVVQQANGESVGEAREAVRNNYIKPAEQKAEEARAKANEARAGENNAAQKATEAESAKKELETAQKQAEKLKTSYGKEEVKQEGEEKVKTANEEAEKANEAVEKAEAEAEKAGEEVKKAEEAAKEAMSGGNVSEMEKKIKELEEARKKAKEVEEAAKKAAEEARKAEEAARKAEAEKEESLDEDKAKDKAKEAEEAARKAEEEAKKAKEEAEKAKKEAEKAKKEAEEAKKKAEEAVKRFKERFGKKKDEIDEELEDLIRFVNNLAYVQIPSYRTTSATFVALEEKTAVNEEYFGEVISYTFYATDDKEIEPEKAATVTPKDGVQILNIFNPDVAKVAIIGTLGRAMLSGRETPGAVVAGAGEIIAKGGDIRVNPDGSIKEIISVGESVDIEKLGDHQVFINGQPVTIVAARENEISIDGYGFEPSQTISDLGTVNMVLQKPDGSTLSKEMPCWMANIMMEPVTHVRDPSAIKLDIAGVPSNQIVDIRFIPGPGQKISPMHVRATAGELKGVIADITVGTAGAQRLDAIVSRGELVDRPLKDAADMSMDELQSAVQDMQLAEGARMLQEIQGQVVSRPSPIEGQMLKSYQNELGKRTPGPTTREMK